MGWGQPTTDDKPYDPIPETVADAIARWDRGDSVFTVEMGGMGPGYEMAIQGLTFELLRALHAPEFSAKIPPHGLDWENEDDKQAVISEMDRVVHNCNGLPWAGFSGAQVGAAQSLAMCLLRRSSYREALREDGVKDRLIQVCKKDLRTA